MKTNSSYSAALPALAVSSLLVFLTYGCSSSRGSRDAAASQAPIWQRQPLVIDGYDGDWAKPLPYYDKKENLSYAISNDRDNLYIMLSTKEGPEQQKILEGGLTVWINNQAEKENSDAVGIGFPTGVKPSREQSLMAAARPDRYQKKPNTLEDDLRAYSLYGFKKDETVENFDSGQVNDEGVEVKIGFNRAHELIYEASVPLNAIYPQNTTHNFTGKTVAVGFVVEGLPPGEGRRRGGGGGPGVSVGGGFGMGSFGSGGGIGLSIGSGAFGGGGRGADRQLYEQTKIWQVVPLARPGAGVH
jgi:hypothetical protein